MKLNNLTIFWELWLFSYFSSIGVFLLLLILRILTRWGVLALHHTFKYVFKLPFSFKNQFLLFFFIPMNFFPFIIFPLMLRKVLYPVFSLYFLLVHLLFHFFVYFLHSFSIYFGVNWSNGFASLVGDWVILEWCHSLTLNSIFKHWNWFQA